MAPQSGWLPVGFFFKGGLKRTRQVEPGHKAGRRGMFGKRWWILECLGCKWCKSWGKTTGNAWMHEECIVLSYIHSVKELNSSQRWVTRSLVRPVGRTLTWEYIYLKWNRAQLGIRDIGLRSHTKWLKRTDFFFWHARCDYAASYLNVASGRVKTEMDTRELAWG